MFREGNQPDRESCRKGKPRTRGSKRKKQEGKGKKGRNTSGGLLKPVSLVESRRGRGVTRIDPKVDKETKERVQR
jgi:hypothetical protein